MLRGFPSSIVYSFDTFLKYENRENGLRCIDNVFDNCLGLSLVSASSVGVSFTCITVDIGKVISDEKVPVESKQIFITLKKIMNF